MPLKAVFALITLGFAAPAALAQEAPAAPPERVSALIVYGNDPCPPSTGDEIVVCGREPESERYRVPKELRKKQVEPSTQTWSDRVSQLEWIGRAGTPNSCSPVGSGGQTGCYNMLLRQARAEREQARRQAAGLP